MAGSNLFRGTLELLILQTLKWGELHGYGIGQWIEKHTEGAISLEEGVLYPALRRMEAKGWIKGKWRINETGRKARFYGMTKKGWAALQKETSRWVEHAGAVFSILRHSDG